MGHRHHHGQGEHAGFGEHFERRWERGPWGFREFGPPPWAFRGPDPRWFEHIPPWMWRGGPGGWQDPEDFGPSREQRIAMLEEHRRRLQHRLERVTEEIRRLRQESSEKREPGTSV